MPSSIAVLSSLPSSHAARNETMEGGDDTASAACTSILYRVCYDPPQ